MKKVKKVEESVTQTWNTFAKLLIETKKAWEQHREVWAAQGTADLEKLPLEFQRFLVRSFNRSKFEVLMPRLIDYYRGYGGIEELEVKLFNKEDKK